MQNKITLTELLESKEKFLGFLDETKNNFENYSEKELDEREEMIL